MNLFLTYETPNCCQNYHETKSEHSDKFEMEIQTISRCGLRSPDNAEFGHFTLLFCRGWQRNVPRIITHVHSHCSSHRPTERLIAQAYHTNYMQHNFQDRLNLKSNYNLRYFHEKSTPLLFVKSMMTVGFQREFIINSAGEGWLYL